MTRSAPRRSAAVVFVVLVVATVGSAFAATALKRTPSYVQRLRIDKRTVDPTVRGSRGTVFIGFSTKRADRARVSIESVSGRTVRTLGPAKPTRPYRRVSFAWRAVDRAGRPLNPGYYFVRLRLLDSDRDLVFDDRSIRVVRARR
ncbi:hypothetical protein AB0L40_05485 [Patulibacter sp. NPDC049589]|uniref:hypothetical protein n=1 Tax=Patulibacter sp. NPDC049589 TaxID=3154731 RepID=UPI003448EEE8